MPDLIPHRVQRRYTLFNHVSSEGRRSFGGWERDIGVYRLPEGNQLA